ncbi:MAG: ATP-binding protein, partial [Chloroflexota bacterium]|nr:ATP-binding protein [Chloroflexota bacterium]
MTTGHYQVLGASVPPMLGRASLMRTITDHLLKPSPDHVSVVGPAYYGKSVVLRHLSTSFDNGSDGYLTASHIDLRHGIPASDGEFMSRFAQEISTVLQGARPQHAELIEPGDEAVHEVLGLVFEELENEGVRLLVVLDGLDYALAGTGLTRNLWDRLRALAQRSSLRLVTGSRRPLRELCRTEESRTSDFWEIFYDTHTPVTALDDGDIEAFLQPLRDAGTAFDESARKEIVNWTGGVPLLVCALLQRLLEEHAGARLRKPDIDRSAEEVLGGRGQLLAALWDDCDAELRSDLRVLSDGDVRLTELSPARRRALEERGYGRVSGNRLRGSCRLMQRYARDQAPAIADLTRVVGTIAGFETHVGSLLELRLAQVSAGEPDEELRDYVSNAIRDLSPSPNHALIWVRSIANRGLKLVWNAELPPDRTLPSKWRSEWRRAEVNYADEDGRLPRSPGAQC